jgi:phosphoribosyl 1,2-cyclic phosphodiesterase
MRISFWGVRGSIASPGPEFNRYGGNTPCVSVTTSTGGQVILDAGTGITVLGRELMKSQFGRGRGRGTLLLTHAHWDHIQGFPFFAPIFIPGNRLTIYGPSGSPKMVEGILEGQMDPHFSPVHSLRNLGAQIEFKATQEGVTMEVEGLRVTARANAHGRYSALAYRLEEGEASIVYAPDAHYPEGRPPAEMERLYAGATALIHDCNYTPEDQRERVSRGHSSIADAARIAALCRVKTLVMFHYDQDYTDEIVDGLRQRCREYLDQAPGGEAVELVAAAEGLTLEL